MRPWLLALGLLVGLLAPLGSAHSLRLDDHNLGVNANPVMYYEHPSAVSLTYLQTSRRRSVPNPVRESERHLDDPAQAHEPVSLSLSAYNTTFVFALYPDNELVHPDASVVVHAADGSVRRYRVAEVATVAPYYGSVRSEKTGSVASAAISWHADPDWHGGDAAYARNPARERDGGFFRGRGGNGRAVRRGVKSPRVEGSWTLDGHTYHVVPTAKYLHLSSAGGARHTVRGITVKNSRSPYQLPSEGSRSVLRRRSSDEEGDNDGMDELEVDDQGIHLIVFRDADRANTSPASSSSSMHARSHEDTESRTGGLCGAYETAWNGDGHAQTYIADLHRNSSLYSASVAGGGSGGPEFQAWDGGEEHGDWEHRMGRMGRRQAIPQITTGCPTSSKILYVGVATDCGYYKLYNSNSQQVVDQAISNLNAVSRIYKTQFNVLVGLLTMDIRTLCGTGNDTATWNQDCPNGIGALNISQRLSEFSLWRGKSKDKTAGLWHLMSTCPTGATIGIAWLNMLCQTTVFTQKNGNADEYVSGTGVSTTRTAFGNEWLVVAHEVGHNFGAKHDCTTQGCSSSSACQAGTSASCACCPCSGCDCKGLYIMNPSTTADQLNETSFSGCTLNTVCGNIKVLGTCLDTPGNRRVFNQQICGNGIIEEGEECDPQGSDTDPCCLKTCKLKPGKQCADSNSACCSNCTINSRTDVVCRAAANNCDESELCTGKTAECPPDLSKADGTTCAASDGSSATCASGLCTSRRLFCQLQGQLFNEPDISSDCPQFGGQCNLFCYSSLRDSCQVFSGYFPNGTACGTGGLCVDGLCTNPDLLGQIIQWIQSNLAVTIVIAVILGILILVVMVYSCRAMARNRGKGAQKLKALAKDINNEERRERRRQEMEAQQAYEEQQRMIQERQAGMVMGMVPVSADNVGLADRRQSEAERQFLREAAVAVSPNPGNNNRRSEIPVVAVGAGGQRVSVSPTRITIVTAQDATGTSRYSTGGMPTTPRSARPESPMPTRVAIPMPEELDEAPGVMGESPESSGMLASPRSRGVSSASKEAPRGFIRDSAARDGAGDLIIPMLSAISYEPSSPGGTQRARSADGRRSVASMAFPSGALEGSPSTSVSSPFAPGTNSSSGLLAPGTAASSATGTTGTLRAPRSRSGTFNGEVTAEVAGTSSASLLLGGAPADDTVAGGNPRYS